MVTRGNRNEDWLQRKLRIEQQKEQWKRKRKMQVAGGGKNSLWRAVWEGRGDDMGGI